LTLAAVAAPLAQVQQGGTVVNGQCSGWTQTRTFSYDQLRRLRSATNPESGATLYTYDGNGNVVGRTDANSIVTTYRYDALNRVAVKHYAAGSGAGDSVYCYDGDTAASHGGTPDWSCAGAPTGST
jgi:YD repeat-containing protein